MPAGAACAFWLVVDAAFEIAQAESIAGNLVSRLPALLTQRPTTCPHGCDTALDHAIMTDPDHRDLSLVAKLDAVAGRIL